MNVMTITSEYNINGGTLTLAEDTLLDFQGGYFTNGTIQGNNAMINAAPYQIFSTSVTLTGTWKVDKVYPEYFGTVGSSSSINSATAINAALTFSNLTGCKVQLLPRDYHISSTIHILGGTTLEGTISGTTSYYNSLSSEHGTNIVATLSSSTTPLISIITEGNDNVSKIDCYRFSLCNLTIINTGSSTAVEIKSADSVSLTPRTGRVNNLIISNSAGYAIDIAGSSYIRIETISISGGKGVRLTGNKLQEFVWMRQIFIGGNSSYPCIEINKGNNIYLSEIDTNDGAVGLLVQNPNINGTTEVFNLFVNRFNSARCNVGIKLVADSGWLTRIKMSELTISAATSAAILITKVTGGSYGFTECTFDNVNIDNMPSGAYAIQEDCMSNGIFTNIRTSSLIQVREYSKLELSKLRTGGVLSASSGSTSYTQVLTTSSIFNKTPIVVVSTNQKIPFSVTTTNTQGGTCSFTVTFSSAPSSAVKIYYYLTGYFM